MSVPSLVSVSVTSLLHVYGHTSVVEASVYTVKLPCCIHVHYGIN